MSDLRKYNVPIKFIAEAFNRPGENVNIGNDLTIFSAGGFIYLEDKGDLLKYENTTLEGAKTKKERFLENIKNSRAEDVFDWIFSDLKELASHEEIKDLLIKAIELSSEDDLIEGMDNGYIDVDGEPPLEDFFFHGVFFPDLSTRPKKLKRFFAKTDIEEKYCICCSKNITNENQTQVANSSHVFCDECNKITFKKEDN